MPGSTGSSSTPVPIMGGADDVRSVEVRLLSGSTPRPATTPTRSMTTISWTAGFQRLKPHHRAAIVLHFYMDLSMAEVADALGVPVGTAKSRIHYAVDALRAALEADERAPIATTGGPHTMITDRYAEERIRSWLIATAPRHLPDRVLTDTYDRTRRMAQASSCADVVVPRDAAASDRVRGWRYRGRRCSRQHRIGQPWGRRQPSIGCLVREHRPDQRPMGQREFGGVLGPVRGAGGRQPLLAGGGLRHLRADRMEANRHGRV